MGVLGVILAMRQRLRRLSALQVIPPLLALAQNRSKLKVYIAHLTDLCHDRDPGILSQLTPPSHYHHSDPDDWEEELQERSAEQVTTRIPARAGDPFPKQKPISDMS